MAPPPLQPVGRTALLLAPIAVLARGVAFLVPVVIAHLFGVTGVTDAFFYALAFPTFILVVLANSLGVVATPLLARVQAEEPGAYRRFSGGVASVAAIASLIVGAVVLLSLGPSLPWITAFDDETRRLTWLFVAELLPFMGLVGASMVVRSSCEVQGRFVPAALSPLLRGAAVILGLVSLGGVLGPHTLPAAMTLGQLAELGWYLAILARAGALPVPNLRLDARLRQVGADALPILGGELLVHLNVVVDKACAGGLVEGSVSLLEYADRLRQIPWALFESTLLPVAFATWANLYARGEHDPLARQIDQSLRWIIAWTAAPLAGLYIGRLVLSTLLFGGGEMSLDQAVAVGQIFGWYVPGLWTVLLGVLALRAHVVHRRLALVLGLGVGSVLLNAVLDVLLVGPMGIEGLALGTSIVWVLVPLGAMAALVPDLRGQVRLRAWLPVMGVAAGSMVTALVVEWVFGAPQGFGDLQLWGAAGVCFALLGGGAWSTRSVQT